MVRALSFVRVLLMEETAARITAIRGRLKSFQTPSENESFRDFLEAFRPYKEAWGYTFAAPKAVHLILKKALSHNVNLALEIGSGFGLNEAFCTFFKKNANIGWRCSDPRVDSDYEWITNSTHSAFVDKQCPEFAKCFKEPEILTGVEAVEQVCREGLDLSKVMLVIFYPPPTLDSKKFFSEDGFSAAIDVFLDRGGLYVALVENEYKEFYQGYPYGGHRMPSL